MKLIDPNKTRDVIERTHLGNNVKLTQHFNGSQDATVKIRAVKISLTQGAPPNKEHVAAIMELEEATKEHRLAKETGMTEWMQYAKRRLVNANVRLRETQ